MKTYLTSKIALVVLSLLLLLSVPFTANAETKAASPPSYTLYGSIKAEVKSISNEKLTDGRRVGAVVRLYNQGTKIVRVPDFEARIITADGVQYTLRPSAANPVAIQPKEKVEMSYLLVVRRTDEMVVSKLVWVKVNKFVYPRKEQRMLSIPISSNPVQSVKWGAAFRFTTLNNSLVYIPTSIMYQSLANKTVAVITMQIENKGNASEIVPNFMINGKANNKVFPGKKIEQNTLTLAPGDKQQIHYAIQVDNDTKLTSLDVLTSDSFVEANQAVTQYNVRRVNISLGVETGDSGTNPLKLKQSYEMNSRISFDQTNSLINPAIKVSMIGLHVHKSEGGGFNIAVAKFKLENTGVRPLPPPVFAAQLIGADGRQYSGTRMNNSDALLAPSLSYVVSYTFNLPASEAGENLVVRLLDEQTIAPYQISIAMYRTSVQQDSSVYPYKVSLNSWVVDDNQLRLNLEIAREENIIVDENFSSLEFEMIGADGKVIESISIPFVGVDRLVNGWQTIDLANADAVNKPEALRVYEVIRTSSGDARRLVTISN